MIQSSVAMTALQNIDDVLVNNLFASNFLRRYVITPGFTVSAAGPLVAIKVGQRIVTQDIAPSTQNRVPIFPDDFLTRFGVVPGDRIILGARETSNNARTLFYTMRFQAV